ncbi:MAG: carbohydrate ABC transporter permease [Eubacteriales bacterium]|nr:carbohydrate ABC transporter permease [Eubacteriales bacterium]MDD3881197.1 carbohydrate ABC transporter permease [Eubacteriales bacterium]MDD4511579.1 carbohydrate ABC transporter permease [Eubacteriales bacterium]
MGVEKSARDYILKFFKHLSLIVASALCVLPVVSCVFAAFKTKEEFAATSKMALPQDWGHLDNFINFWNDSGIGLGFLTSIFVMIVVITLSVMMGSMLAYVLNRFKFRGNALIRNLFLYAALFPTILLQVTVYKLMIQMHLVDSLIGYIILQTGTDVIAIYILLQYFENLSVSLDESAVLEGCTYFGVFFKILLPLLRPAIVTCMILKGVGIYNEYYNASLYLQSKNKYKTVSTALYNYLGPTKSQYEIICAGVLICIVPILIIFLVFQKQVYSGMTNGAVKG